MNYIEPKSVGKTVIPVLSFLNGLEWNATTKNMLMAIRPSAVRESWGSIKLDGMSWRVTVYLKGDEKAPRIDYMEQEVFVGLDGGFEHAYALEEELRKMGSPLNLDEA